MPADPLCGYFTNGKIRLIERDPLAVSDRTRTGDHTWTDQELLFPDRPLLCAHELLSCSTMASAPGQRMHRRWRFSAYDGHVIEGCGRALELLFLRALMQVGLPRGSSRQAGSVRCVASETSSPATRVGRRPSSDRPSRPRRDRRRTPHLSRPGGRSGRKAWVRVKVMYNSPGPRLDAVDEAERDEVEPELGIDDLLERLVYVPSAGCPS